MAGADFPLAPYRVLDLTTGGAMIAGQVLSDLGAEVTIVEPPDGSSSRCQPPFIAFEGADESTAWHAYSRGKGAVCIDIDGDPAAFLALAATADVVLESAAPGYMAGLGLGYTDRSEPVR